MHPLEAGSTVPAQSASSIPLVSIVIPAFNAAAYVQPCLTSVLREIDAARLLAKADFEIIVVDDRSQDMTGTMARDLLAGRHDARVITHERNSGPAAARNTGVDASRGDYVLFLDSDNTLLDGALVRIGDALREHADADVIILGMDLIDEHGKRVGLFYGGRIAASPLRRLEGNPLLLLDGNIMDAFGIIRAPVARAARYDESLCQLSDWDFWLRLYYEHRCRFAMLEASVGGYRLHAGQMSEVHTPKTKSYVREMLRIHAKALALAVRENLPAPVVQRLIGHVQNAGFACAQFPAASAEAAPQGRMEQSTVQPSVGEKTVPSAPARRKAGMNVLDVSHGGDSSDIVYGLALARRIAEAHSCRVNLYVPRHRPAQLGRDADQVSGREFMMSQAAFDFLQPYLAMQPYIKEVLFVSEAEIPPGAVRLDPYRFLQGLNVSAGNIADFAGKIYGISVDASEAWLQAHKRGEDGPRWLITLGFSMRHRNAAIDYSFLAPIEGIRFVGLPEEYEDFRRRHALPNLIHHRCATALELAEAIGAARVFVGNQSLAFAIAEGLKVNRALESCELAPNVVPSGQGGGSFIFQSGLVSLLRNWGVELPEQASRSAPPKYVFHMASRATESAGGAAPGLPVPEARVERAPLGIRIVCATRMGREAFFSDAALGKWLTLRRPADVELRLFPRNGAGLPSVYNTAIAESANKDVILLFVHDDVHLCDFYWADRLREGLSAFDIVGLAGNRRRVPRQAGWVFLDERLTRDDRENLSGMVGHGSAPALGSIDEFGPSGQEVKLLDGLFIAAKSETLRAKALRFDERFDFHFYDLDLCRQAERAGLRMGTWPISVVHESAGSFRTDGWYRGYEKYLEKWKE